MVWTLLTLGLELCIVLVEIGMYLIDVAILFECISCELMKVGPDSSDGCIAIKHSKPHDRLEHERGYKLGFTIYDDFTILAISKQSCFGLLGEAVIQTVPHLFIVLCHLFVWVDAFGENEGLASCFECVGIELAVFINEADLSSVSVCELEYVLDPLVPSHHACLVLWFFLKNHDLTCLHAEGVSESFCSLLIQTGSMCCGEVNKFLHYGNSRWVMKTTAAISEVAAVGGAW